MKMPKEYFDSNYGVKPHPDVESFNNIVYLLYYIRNRMLRKKLTNQDLTMVNYHLKATRDQNGLYKPKNSHDNLTAKMLLSETLSIPNDMKYSAIFKNLSMLLRPWDLITYGVVFGPKIVRILLRPLLIIPALQMIQSCATAGKVRPKLIEKNDLKSSRILWMFFKKLDKVEETELITYKHYKTPFGPKVERHMQNDGKHLTIFRLNILKDKFFEFKICAKICRYILRKQLGDNYGYEVVNRHFSNRQHPLIGMYRDYGDLLK